MLTYSLSGADASSFDIDSDGQITVAMGVTFDIATQDAYIVTVTADDGSGEANATATVEVTITVTAGPVLPPVIIIGPAAAAVVAAAVAAPARARSTSSGP